MEPRINGTVNYFSPSSKNKEHNLKTPLVNGANGRMTNRYLDASKGNTPPATNGTSSSEDDTKTLQAIQEKNRKMLQAIADDTTTLQAIDDGNIRPYLHTAQNDDGNVPLQTIEEENGSSGDSSSSDSDSSDSSDPSITTFSIDNAQESPEKPTGHQNVLCSGNEATSGDSVSPSLDNAVTTKLVQVDALVQSSDNKPKNDITLNHEPLPRHLPPVARNDLTAGSQGSSDVVFGIKDKNVMGSSQDSTDLDGKELNHSGPISGGSDSKDRNDMLAELQKIVEDENQLKQSSLIEAGVPSLPSVKDAVQLSPGQGGPLIDLRDNRGSISKNESLPNTSTQRNNFAMSSNNSSSHPENQINNDLYNNDQVGSHGNSSHSDDHGDLSGEQPHNERNKTGDGQNHEKLCESQAPANTRQNTANNLTALRSKENFENIEKKLNQLEVSNTEQTSEIKRLKDVNESLKNQFKQLEEMSGHHHKIEDQMLKKNEELEKHLLGVLKSQEVIFAMRQEMGAVTAANEKLTKDYQEAVKALEAVDKLFSQKDDLVKKWKDASDESRRLVELLKKHNAEVADLETVDKLKEEIAKLQKQLLKAEETNKEHSKKNGELREQSKMWRGKFEYENEQTIKLNYELQEVKKESKSHQKLAAKRGRKNQMLHLEMTELKDKLKLAKEKTANNEMKLKELEQKNSTTQEMYTSIIHEKEKQHSVLIKNSELQQKDLITKVQMIETLRKEIDSLKTKIHDLANEKMETEEKLMNSKKDLESSLAKQDEVKTDLQNIQSELEQSKIEKVDNDLYIEEQSVQIKELEEQCRDLQEVVKQFILRNTNRPKRQKSRGKLPLSRSLPAYSNMAMYRQLLVPPKTMRSRPHPTLEKTKPSYSDRGNAEFGQDNNEVGPPFFITSTPTEHTKSVSPSRPRSTYGNRQLHNKQEHEQSEQNKEWLPKVVLVDSKKLEASSESGLSADQYAMEYVKVGDKVLIEMQVEGKNQNLPGVVKYVGPVYHRNFKMGIYAGLKLDLPVGDTNGTLAGRMYFRCLPTYGKFIQLSHILAIQNQRTKQYTTILPVTK